MERCVQRFILWAVVAILAFQGITPDRDSLSSSWLLRFVSSDLFEINSDDAASAPIQESDDSGAPDEVCTFSVAGEALHLGCPFGKSPRSGSLTVRCGRVLVAPTPYRLDRKTFTAVASNGHIQQLCRLTC